MPKTRKVQLSFSGGEIDTQMYGRIDAQQYQSGLATCKNWMVDPRGSLRRRPGMQRVADSLDSTKKSRLIPFTYSVDQQLAIELTDQKVRFHAGGGTLVWADLKEFERLNVNTTDNTILFNEPHGFAQNDRITFYAEVTTGIGDAFSALPDAFADNQNQNWHVDVVDSKRIRVLDGSAGSVKNIGTRGSDGFRFYAFLHGEADGKVGPARIMVQWNTGTGTNAPSLWQGSVDSNNNPIGTEYCLHFSVADATQVGFQGRFYQGECVELVYRDASNNAVRVPGLTAPLYVDYTAGGTAGCSNRFGLRTSLEYVDTPKGSPGDTYVSRTQIQAAADTINNQDIWIRQFHKQGDFIYVNDASDVNTPTGVPVFDTGRLYRVTKDFGSPWLPANTSGTALANWNAVRNTSLEDADPQGALSITTPFTESELFDIEYDQSGDVVTLTHPNHPPQDLKRFGPTNWTLGPVDFSPELPAPTNVSGTEDRGQAYLFRLGYDDTTLATGNLPEVNATVLSARNLLDFHPFSVGDQVYISNSTVSQQNVLAFFGIDSTTIDRYYTVAEVGAVSGNTTYNQLTLRASNGVLVEHDFAAGGAVSQNFYVTGAHVAVYYSVADADDEQKYKVTAVDPRGQESLPSAELRLDNVLSVPGASNTITFDAVPNARSYNIYKEINGTFGFIGQVDNKDGVLSYSFEDDNIGPDLSQTLPIPDSQVQESFQPRAAARFEQRRCFGGSDALPRTLFMSRTGTESSFSYRFPVQPDDRISVDIASREAHVIRHIVPVQDLMLLTQQGEFRVTAINSDAITPSTIAIRQQSYVGSNNVHPQVVNNSVVFCANRGGHARELNYRAESQGYLTGDLSLRAAHLFDGFTLDDLAYSKAPIPVLWFVSSNGKLLCLTYIPEERVLAWHQHETGGAVESICSVSEGNFDNLYVIVKRGDDRVVERLVQVRDEDLEDAVYLDASFSHDGTNTDSTATFSLFATGRYLQDDTVTVTAVRAGLFSSEDEGDVLEFTSGGTQYRVLFQTYVSATEFTGKLLSDLPSALKDTPTSSWAWARKTFSGYSHLAGQDVTVLSDGTSQSTVTVSATGTVTLTDYAVKICAGLPYTSQAKTLPMSLEIEAGAQGRTKSVNQVFVRVENTGTLRVGMDEADLKSVTELSNTALKTGEFRTSVPSTWDEEGQIVVEATGAAPASLLNITTQVSLGD